MNDNVAELRTEYLNILRKLVVAVFQRSCLERVELCPEGNPEPDTAALEKYSKLRIKIASLTQEIRLFEEKNAGFGVCALLGQEPEIPVRIACSLLLAKSISDSVSRIRTVSEVCDYSVGSQNPMDTLSIRQSFARSGILRPHCSVVIREVTLDEMYVTLKEKSICRMLNLPESDALEFEIMAERMRR